jgi:hypothetical protein
MLLGAGSAQLRGNDQSLHFVPTFGATGLRCLPRRSWSHCRSVAFYKRNLSTTAGVSITSGIA